MNMLLLQNKKSYMNMLLLKNQKSYMNMFKLQLQNQKSYMNMYKLQLLNQKSNMNMYKLQLQNQSSNMFNLHQKLNMFTFKPHLQFKHLLLLHLQLHNHVLGIKLRHQTHRMVRAKTVLRVWSLT